MQSKKYIFLFLVLLTSFMIAINRSYEKLDQNMIVSVFQPTETIISLNNKIDLKNFSAYYIDRLNFPANKEVWHYKLGGLGFQKNLHVIIEMWINVLIEGEYEFQILTDCGVGFQINGSPMSSHIFIDKAKNIKFKKRLNKGQHKITIIKIHREGDFVIEAKYRLSGEIKFYNVGESSNYIEYIELDLWNE